MEAPDPIDELRAVVASTPSAPPELTGYLTKVRKRAYTVTDGEVEVLKESGVSEDEIFEQTVAAAIDEGLRRLDAAQAVIG
jgi:alkylhydroperoxidase family enzyme